MNHLNDDKLIHMVVLKGVGFLNHLNDDKLSWAHHVKYGNFLNHLNDDKLELSINKTPKIN